MFPLARGTSVDIEALSGICGSISIACWVVVYSPQIIENFRRGSADGLSVLFLVVWSLGDLFNVIGGVLQGVLPTMIILALYYTFGDAVLVGQVIYYKGFTLSDRISRPEDGEEEEYEDDVANEEQPLLSRSHSELDGNLEPGHVQRPQPRKTNSQLSRHISSVDATHLSPAVPLLDASKSSEAPAMQMLMPTTGLQTFIFNLLSILLVCGAGALGWWIGQKSNKHGAKGDELPPYPEFNILGQIFGYLCALFYLGSRIPQLLLNFRRKSTEGVSLLFFLFACMGNLTYIMSICAYDPVCEQPRRCEPGEAASIYGRYISVNASWIVGSAGTLFLDMIIFWQFFLYKKDGRDRRHPEAEGTAAHGHS